MCKRWKIYAEKKARTAAGKIDKKKKGGIYRKILNVENGKS